MTTSFQPRFKIAIRATLVLGFFGSFLVPSVAQPLYGDAEKRSAMVVMPSARVEIVTHKYGDPAKAPWLLCNVHDDEDTSVHAALMFMRSLKGQPVRLVELHHTGERNILFGEADGKSEFDPNRMFTAAGVRKTLEERSEENEEVAGWNETAQKIVEGFGKELIRRLQLDQIEVVVALHNNTEGKYAATNYLKGQEYEKEAESVHISPDKDPDDFFFVTDRRIYEALKARDVNVVLQDNEAVTDDGSLSVYCGQKGKPYVNVEAQHGHLEEQVKMIGTLWEVLEKLPAK